MCYALPHAHYRRAFIPGGCFFFTVNLLERRQTLLVDAIGSLREAVATTRRGGDRGAAQPSASRAVVCARRRRITPIRPVLGADPMGSNPPYELPRFIAFAFSHSLDPKRKSSVGMI
jgi:hypothetical protein